jgi:type I restriction enzyme S subunit
MTELPNGWSAQSLASLVVVLDSKRKPVNSKERAGRRGTIPYYGATGQVGTIDYYIFNEDLVILGEDGAPFLDTTRPKAYLIRGKSWVNNHAHVLRCDGNKYQQELLVQYLNWIDFRPYVNGTTRLKLTQGSMNEIPVLVPPLAEQQRIVEILEEQFSRLDAALASIRTVRGKAKVFRRSLLQAAFKGRLSENGTAGWEIKKLKEVAHVQLGRQRSPQHHHGENMRPYLRAANVTWSGLDLSDVKEMNFTDAELEVFRLLPKDILINEASGSASALGKPAMFHGEIEDCAFQNHLIRVRAQTAVAEYLYWYLLHNALSGAYHSESSGIGILNLGKTRVASWSVPIPPSVVQLQLVQTLDEQFSRLDAALNVANQLEARIASERRSLLHAAFSGTLTTQWRETQNG